MRKLQRPVPVMQPCTLAARIHKRVYTCDEEVKPQRPEGQVCEEAKGLANGGVALLDGVAGNIEVFEVDGCRGRGEPDVAGYDGGEGVDAEKEADAGESGGRYEWGVEEGARVVGAGGAYAPGRVGEELHDVEMSGKDR